MYSGSPNNQENTVFVIYLQLYVLSLGRWISLYMSLLVLSFVLDHA